MNTSRYISIQFALIAALGALCVLAPVSVSFADESQLSIAGNGQVIVRNATVTSVQAHSLTATARWGASSISWTVLVSGSTRLTPESDSLSEAVKVGDSVSFSGSLQGGPFTVKASALKNASILKESSIISGSVERVDIDGGTVTLRTAEEMLTLKIGSGTIVTRDGDGASIGQLVAGDSIRAQGTLDTSLSTFNASRVVISHEDPIEVEGEGFFSGILGWLKSSRGLLSFGR